MEISDLLRLGAPFTAGAGRSVVGAVAQEKDQGAAQQQSHNESHADS